MFKVSTFFGEIKYESRVTFSFDSNPGHGPSPDFTVLCLDDNPSGITANWSNNSDKLTEIFIPWITDNN